MGTGADLHMHYRPDVDPPLQPGDGSAPRRHRRGDRGRVRDPAAPGHRDAGRARRQLDRAALATAAPALGRRGPLVLDGMPGCERGQGLAQHGIRRLALLPGTGHQGEQRGTHVVARVRSQ